jgi:CubicO group peptidase (beta-lactamase class C family)
MRNATKGLLLATVVFGLASAASADFCDDQYWLYVHDVLPTLKQGVGGVVVTWKLGKGSCFFPYGEIEKGKGVVPDKKTVFELASGTKVFTTAILGLHVVNPPGLLTSLPVEPYLPDGFELKHGEQGVTFQQLATFTGGFWWSDPPKEFKSGATFTEEEFQRAVKSLDPNGGSDSQGPIPGEQYLPTVQFYSNSSVGLLGQVLMQMDAPGQTLKFDANEFSSWVSDNLTGPARLNMPNTKVHPGGTLATGYLLGTDSEGNTTYKSTKPWAWEPWGAAGGLRSTANDMLTFLKANICAHNMSDDACKDFPVDILSAMLISHNPQNYEPPGNLTDPIIQLGFCGSQKEQAWAWIDVEPPAFNPKDEKPILYKGGDHPGFASFIGFSPGKNYGLVILANSHPLHVDPAGLQMIRDTP